MTAQTAMQMIEVRGLCKEFDGLQVLSGIDLTVQRGEIVSVIGPSGSGKSTLLRSIIQLEEINRGTILIEGEPVVSIDERGHRLHIPRHDQHRRLRRLGMVFQNFNLFPHRSVLQNLTEAPLVVDRIPRTVAEERAEQMLLKVGLADKRDSYPWQLSGGQQQRVAIARALVNSPDIMLFDEPTSALDPELVGEVLAVIRALAEEHMTMLIVTHEMRFARDISDRVLFLDEGRKVADAPPAEIFENPDHPRIRQFLKSFFNG